MSRRIGKPAGGWKKAIAIEKKNSDVALWHALLSLLLFVSIILLPLSALIFWHEPTRVSIDLNVSRVVFTLPDGKENVPVFPTPVTFRDISVEGFERVSFTPQSMQIADPKRADSNKWIPIRHKGEVILKSIGDNKSTFTLEGVDSGLAPTGRLESISARPASTVSVQATSSLTPALTLKIDGHALSPSILPVGTFDISAHYAELEGIAQSTAEKALSRFRVTLAPSAPYLESVSHPSGLTVTITSAGSSGIRLLEKNGASIKSISFGTQKENGDLETTLVGSSQITYQNYPKKKSIPLTDHDYLSLSDLSNTSITNLFFDAQKRFLILRVDGTVGHMQTGLGSSSTDRRSTYFDRVYYSVFFEYFVGAVTALASMWMALVKWHEGLNKAVSGWFRRSE